MTNIVFSREMLAFADERISSGQHAFSMVTRALMFRHRPDLAERLDFEDDSIFLEPVLIARLTQPSDPMADLEQVLFASLSSHDKERGIRVTADANGTVDIPRIGTFVGLPANARLDLAWRGDRPILSEGSEPIRSDFIEPLRIAGVPEVSRCLPSILAPLFRAPTSVRIDVSAGAHHAAHLRAAFGLLCGLCPDLHRHILGVVRRLVVFALDDHNSFADLRAHGTAFINIAAGDDDVFLVEDLAHQCGHVVFSALTFERDAFLAVPSATPLAAADPTPGEDRTVYTALHGVFTEACMVQALSAWLERDAPPAGSRRRHEIEGRLAFILLRFGRDLSSLRRETYFTAVGDWFVAEFEKMFESALARWRSLVREVDLTNQSYNFNYQRYLHANRLS